MLDKVIQFLNTINNTTAKYVDDSISLLKFNIDGLNYLAEYNPDKDPTYFRIMLPYIDLFEDSLSEILMNRMLKISTTYKVGKFLLFEKSVWLSAEVFIGDTSASSVILPRMISLLRDMLNAYREEKTNEGK